jgi:hypothetical protein
MTKQELMDLATLVWEKNHKSHYAGMENDKFHFINGFILGYEQGKHDR